MKKFNVVIVSTSYLSKVIDAESEEKAEEIAEELDGGEFREFSCSWTVESVKEYTINRSCNRNMPFYIKDIDSNSNACCQEGRFCEECIKQYEGGKL
jgi:hypothetical protein